MQHAIVALVAAVSLLLAPVGAAAAPSRSPSVSESPAPSPEPVEPPAIDPAPSTQTVAPAEAAPEATPGPAPDPGVVPPPPETPPPADLGEQVEEAIVEQATQDVVPGPFVPQPVPFTPPAAVGPQTVQCYGDSILGNVCGTGATSPLRAALPGWTTLAYSLGGHTSTSIAVNAGAYRMQLTQPVTIAATDATNLPVPYLFEVPADMMGGVILRVSIAGVTGTLIHRPDIDISWRFVRDNAGDAVDVAPGTPIVSLQAMAPGAASIIWAGTNNLTAPDQIVADVSAMVALHKSMSDQPFWVVSVTPAWGNSGSIYGIARAQANKELDRLYGDRYVPLDEYIANGAITDAGLVPTASDRSWIGSGLNPPVFHSAQDWVHFNRTGSEAIARFLARFVIGGTTAALQRALFNAEAALQVDVQGTTVTLRGWAFDRSDLYQSIPVGMTVDDGWIGAIYAGNPSPELGAFGVPASHGFSWSTSLAGGRTYKICIVGVGIGAGANAYPPCVSVTIPLLLPQGDLSLVDVGGGTMAIMGWGFDHADLYAQIPVGLIVDGRWLGGVTAALPSPYLRPYGVPGDHAFFAGAQLGRGSHSVCAVGVSNATGRSAVLGCSSLVLQ